MFAKPVVKLAEVGIVRRSSLSIILLFTCFYIIGVVVADTSVNELLQPGDSVSFNGLVGQGNRIRLDLESTGTPLDYFILTPEEFTKWENEQTFAEIQGGHILINSSTPIITDVLNAGRYYVVLENSNSFIRGRVTGSISFDYELIISTTPSNSEPIVPFFPNPLVLVSVASIGIVIIITAVYFKRKPSSLQDKEIIVEPITPSFSAVETTPFYLRGPRSPAMLVVFSFGLLNVASGLMFYSLFQETLGIVFLLGGLLICSHIFTTPGGEFIIYGHLMGLAITIVWLFANFPSAEIQFVFLRIFGMTLGLVSSMILILRNWVGPFQSLDDQLVITTGEMTKASGSFSGSEGGRLKCPFCSSTYRYSASHVLTDGSIRCQNCMKQFNI